MATKTYTLTDVARGAYQPEFTLGPADVGGRNGDYAITKRTLRGGLQDGVDVVEVFNGVMQFAVLPTRGMGLWRVRQQKQQASVLGPQVEPGVELGWKSPVACPVNPAFVQTGAANGIGWLDGFGELLVRCGLQTNGAPDFDPETGHLRHPLHGRIANTPAHHVEVGVDPDSGEITVRGVMDEARLYHNKLRLTSTYRVRPGSYRIDLVDEVTCLSQEPTTLQLLYHCNLGQPLLEPGARVVLPARRIVPISNRAAEGLSTWDTYGPEQPGFTEQVFLFELLSSAAGMSGVLLKNAHDTAGASLAFRLDQLPYFAVWKSTQAALDGYVTGLEPATGFPNTHSYELAQGRVLSLSPGETRRFELSLELHPTAASVHEAESAIRAIQGGEHAIIEPAPVAGWSAQA